MKTFITLFRGINVGGNNILPMKELRSSLESIGLHEVKTYIQSGNVVFQSEKSESQLSDLIFDAVKQNHNIEARVHVLELPGYERIVAANPYPDAIAEPKTLHIFFLTKPATDPNIELLDSAKSPSEAYTITDQAFYLHAPDGIGRSKLATLVEKALRVPVLF